MFDNFQYAYIIGNLLVGLPIWLLLFVHRKDLRKEILLGSLSVGIFAVISGPLFVVDYWDPIASSFWIFTIGNFAYGFFFGGIANAIYEVIFGKRYAKRKDRTYNWIWFAIPFTFLIFFIFRLPALLGINSIYAISIVVLLIALIMVYFRRDLWLDSLMSGLLVGLITLFGFILFFWLFPGIRDEWWKLSNLSGIFVLGVPIEEMLSAFGLGASAGPFYEFFVGLRFKK